MGVDGEQMTLFVSGTSKTSRRPKHRRVVIAMRRYATRAVGRFHVPYYA